MDNNQPAPESNNNNKGLDKEKVFKPAPEYQYVLDLNVRVEKTINGIEMGVLENGIPYLTQEGVSKLCGISRSVIYDISKDWVKHLSFY